MSTFLGRMPGGSRKPDPALVALDMIESAGSDADLRIRVIEAARAVLGDEAVAEALAKLDAKAAS